MRVLRIVCTGLGLMLAAAPASADTASHVEAARAFYEVARLSDPAAASAVVAEMVARVQPGLARHRDILEEFARELLSSPAYADAQVNVYADLYSEEDLRTLAWLFQHETYRRYLDRRVELVQRSTGVTLDIFRRSLPELQRRIRERGGVEESGSEH
jgi:hypothetical protein